MDEELIGFEEALALTLEAVEALPCEEAPLAELAGRIAGASAPALVDVPTADISLREGYAVRAAELETAVPRAPVHLRLLGVATAGHPFAGEWLLGSAVRVLTGAMIPAGADAVVVEEDAVTEEDSVLVLAPARPGLHILPRGADFSQGSELISPGVALRPAHAGLLAAAGYTALSVVRRPTVGIIATGDELVPPGGELRPGLVYTSNVATNMAWCAHYGFATRSWIVADDSEAIERAFGEALSACDAVVTTGGAWRGERDLVAGTLERLGWRKLYHHVRLSPGKSAGFGLWQGKPVFCLPGSPTANQATFLYLVLPALLKLAGYRSPALPVLMAELAADLPGREGWTQFVEGELIPTATGFRFRPRKAASRLRSMAQAEALALVPEGIAGLRRGSFIPVQPLPGALLPERPPVAAPTEPSGPVSGGKTRAPKIVSFVAKSGAGKTTFLERLVPALVARNVRVGVVKHHAHTTPFDVPGKDTYRLSEAGADVVVGASAAQVAVFRREDGSADVQAIIERDMAGMDLVLTEGFKRGPYPKIEVHRRTSHLDLLCEPHELLALVTDEPFDYAVPQFSLDDPEGVAGFLVNWLGKGE